MTAYEPFLSCTRTTEQRPAEMTSSAGRRTRPGRAARCANRGWFILGDALAAAALPGMPGGGADDSDRRERYLRIVRRAAAS